MSNIKTFARIRPTDHMYDDFELTPNRIYVRVPENVTSNALWAVKPSQKSVINHEFKFDHVFHERASQEQVFEKVAVPVVQGFLNGYNGTIFAYGQTGSGKTHTVEGDNRQYSDRGLAARALSMIYKSLARRDDEEVQVKISYMEIYQEIGYDLLSSAAKGNNGVLPFPKVSVVEGAKGSCLIRNLSTHLAANEEAAQNFLYQGEANRKVAETPMNQRSSRSHAVVTIYLTARKHNLDIVVKSKLHLVDLAGSERVSKTGTIGLQLSEAKYINLSLHYLEGVIIALQKESGSTNGQRSSLFARPHSRPFSSNSVEARLYNRWVNSVRHSTALGLGNNTYVPYRNSLLTMVLRDSLGGNCQTVMVATISMEPVNLSETLSTCRFAQRVACITNTLRKNEEIDDKSMIRRLRKRIAELELQLNSIKDGSLEESSMAEWSAYSKLTDKDKLECARITEAYLDGRLKDPVMAGITNPVKFRECLHLLRQIVQETGQSVGGYIRPISAPLGNNANTVEGATEQATKQIVVVLPNVTEDEPSDDSCSYLKFRSSPLHARKEEEPEVTEAGARPGSNTTPSHSGGIFKLTESQQDPIGGQLSVQTNSTSLSHHMIGQNGRLESRPTTASNLTSIKEERTCAEWAVRFPERSREKSRNIEEKVNNSTPKLKSTTNDPNILYNENQWDMPGKKSTSNNGQGSSAMGSRSSLRSAGSKSSGRGWRKTPASPNGSTATTGAVNGRQKYQSPFERAREREIEQLDRRVGRRESEMRDQQQSLHSLQHSVKLQKLQLLKNEVRVKVESTRLKAQEQGEFLGTLEGARADPSLLEQERLVYKQLLKRQHRMQARLDALDHEMKLEEDLHNKENKDENQNFDLLVNKQAVAPQPARATYRSVLDKLQTQEKQQAKASKELERARVMTLSEQVSVKEAATRQKLQEFKDKLRQSQLNAADTDGHTERKPPSPEQPHNTSVGMMSMWSDVSISGMQPPWFLDNEVEETNGRAELPKDQVKPSAKNGHYSSTKPGFSETSVSGQRSRKSSIENNKDAQSNSANSHQMGHGFKNENESATSKMKLISSSKHIQNEIADSTALLKKLIEQHKNSKRPQKSAASVWESGYTRDSSRPQTEDNSSMNLGTASDFSQVHNTSLQGPGQSTSPIGARFDPDYELTPRVDYLRVDQDEYITPSSRPQSSNASVRSYDCSSNNKSGPEHRVKPLINPGLEPKPNKPQHKLKSTNLYSQNANSSSPQQSAIYGYNSNATDSFKLSEASFNERSSLELEGRPRTSTHDSDNSIPSFEKYLPTDYIYQNHEQSFDARKMGLRHHDFDSALQRMLTAENRKGAENSHTSAAIHIKPVPSIPVYQHYDQFAREKSKPKKNSATTAAKQIYTAPQQKPAKITQKTSTAPTSLKPRPMWGPEAKNMPISERLKGFGQLKQKSNLGKSDTSPPTNKPVPKATEKTRQGVSSGTKSNHAGEQPKPEIDVNRFKLKIKPVVESEREQSFERSVRQQKDRVAMIRQVRSAAETIQRAWRRYQAKKQRRK